MGWKEESSRVTTVWRGRDPYAAFVRRTAMDERCQVRPENQIPGVAINNSSSRRSSRSGSRAEKEGRGGGGGHDAR